MWKRRRATASQPPDPQSKTRSLRYAFGKKIDPSLSLSLSLDMYTLHDPPPIPGSAPAIARLANGKSTTGLGLLIWWTRLLLGPMEFCLQVWPWRAWRGWWHHHGVANRNNKWRQMDWWIMVNWQLAKDFLRDGLWDLFGLSIWTAVRVYSQVPKLPTLQSIEQLCWGIASPIRSKLTKRFH